MDTLFTLAVAGVVTLFFVVFYARKNKKLEEKARIAAEQGKLYSDGPMSQHPQIDLNRCIGCASCTSVCPEGDVLGMIGGKAAIVKGYKCIGHSLCADACPVGAITMVMASPSANVNMPYLTPEHETSIRNLFIIGELGGLALIKNAVNEGRDTIDVISGRLQSNSRTPGLYDVVIVGAGPAGISASLRAIEKNLNYVTLEQGDIGGTVARYPRQKLVMTSPVEFPLYGKFKKTELSKENLIEFWQKVMHRADFKARTGEKVVDIKVDAEGNFQIMTEHQQYSSRALVLALGRSGTPRKLGVKGEELPKVMYRLIEADHYTNKSILIVGGGDSAVEAAMGLANQIGNRVTLSYRQSAFSRIKDRNAQRIADCQRRKKIDILFDSNVVEIKQNSVVLDVAGVTKEIPNDYVWVFAGGTPPYELVKNIGVSFGMSSVTAKPEPIAVASIR
jgi:thioredoxin reductase (NADPH)